MSRDDLRALLEKIAATAGDPPEHGLDGVAARRRRRTRHRRGAVATAVALAVLGIAVYPRIGWLADDHDVTAAGTGNPTRPAQMPEVVELRCTPDGFDVPVASIRPQEDGLHLTVENGLPYPTEVQVTSEAGWDSGRISVEPGTRRLRMAVAPGVLTVACRIGVIDERRRVDLVDVNGIYDEPELSCADDQRRTLPDEPVDPPRAAYADAIDQVLTVWQASGHLQVEVKSGYRSARFGDPTVDPVIQVVQDGDVMMFAHLVGQQDTEGGPAEPRWSAVTNIEYCFGLLGGEGGTTAPSA